MFWFRKNLNRKKDDKFFKAFFKTILLFVQSQSKGCYKLSHIDNEKGDHESHPASLPMRLAWIFGWT
jgi:hypothetical protein